MNLRIASVMGNTSLRMAQGLWGLAALSSQNLLEQPRNSMTAWCAAAQGAGPPNAEKSGLGITLKAALMQSLKKLVDIKRLTFELALSRHAFCPFGDRLVREGRAIL